MTIRAVGPAAGWSWLKQAINLGRNNPRALFGAAALVMVVALVPSVVQLVVQQGLGVQDPSVSLWIVGLTTLAMLAVYPLLIGGFFRVIHATENDHPTHATAVFDAFRAGNGGLRLVVFGVVLSLVYLLVFAVILMSVGKDVASWYFELITAAQGAVPGATPNVPTPPAGLGAVVGLGLLVSIYLTGVYSIGFGQVALGTRSVGGAFADGFSGALKNLLPLLVLAIISLLAMLLVALVFGLVIGLLAAVGGFVHPALGIALAVPVYLLLMVALYVVMFGVMYFMWRDVAGAPVALADDRVEL